MCQMFPIEIEGRTKQARQKKEVRFVRTFSLLLRNIFYSKYSLTIFIYEYIILSFPNVGNMNSKINSNDVCVYQFVFLFTQNSSFGRLMSVTKTDSVWYWCEYRKYFILLISKVYFHVYMIHPVMLVSSSKCIFSV